MNRNPIFVAIDEADPDRAKTLVRSLSGVVGGIKLGLEFFMANGPVGVQRVMEDTDLPLFLDMKFHDIPTTVRKAMAAACRIGPAYVTVHCAGLHPMMQAAVEAAQESEQSPVVLGVTTLTSQPATYPEVVGKAVLAVRSGCGGVVCSAHEARPVKSSSPQTLIFVPGVRMGGATDDQHRVATPREAISQGADFIVIGRAITQAADPVLAAHTILQSIEN